jgi:hypothetical protein
MMSASTIAAKRRMMPVRSGASPAAGTATRDATEVAIDVSLVPSADTLTDIFSSGCAEGQRSVSGDG